MQVTSIAWRRSCAQFLKVCGSQFLQDVDYEGRQVLGSILDRQETVFARVVESSPREAASAATWALMGLAGGLALQ